MSTAGAPAGDGNYPVSKEYGGHALLSDHAAYFMSSFTPQFNWFLARGYQDNSFYREMNTRWLKADKLFWSNTLTDTSTIWGTPVRNRSWQLDKPTNLIVEMLSHLTDYYYYYYARVWGAGAGPCPTGYCVEKINNQGTDLIISAAIMAGFLPNADTAQLREEINQQLEWMYEQQVCRTIK